jgi:hypothetical protein
MPFNQSTSGIMYGGKATSVSPKGFCNTTWSMTILAIHGATRPGMIASNASRIFAA